ncbi:enoyl-CoA hydratase [Nocardioides mangrovicus]|uniref:Enoyl-CoA hydratase n=1 Tax=Nocardioides mangrovicus TaxID=2478913 RepID=A0A3L8NWD8_9ACTN|nr:enoyl-CoA hydratase-related protein [Nocardioides mangrovicus]RLV47465.1 enoyl-CoA hydratase [Nocardioides mangrovicus]
MSVRQEQLDRVLVVTIEREAKRNAIDQEVADGIDAAMNRLEDDPGLWVGVLTGGPRMFSAGTDLAAGMSPRTERGGEYGVVRRRRAKPLIACVEGLALGGGFELVLACDLVVASTTASFGLPETRRGVVASSGGLFRAPQALPRQVAAELMLAGARLDASRAHALGLVSRLVEPGRALGAALALAAEICLASPYAVGLTLGALAEVGLDEDTGWATTAAAVAAVKESEDMREGVNAFLEKRAPRWTGR